MESCRSLFLGILYSVMTLPSPVRCGKWRRVVSSGSPLRSLGACSGRKSSRLLSAGGALTYDVCEARRSDGRSP
jgi:hypothetical protein